jgi:GNAT superfamily N-acetyltransferase
LNIGGSSTPPAVGCELLARHHDRLGFSCGNAALDRYLQRQASQDVRRHLASVFVLSTGSGVRILGYYTLTATSVLVADLPPDETRRIPYPEVPATLLGRLAVDSEFQGRGYGGYMLIDAGMRALSPSAPASFAMIVDAIDEAAAQFYSRFGFIAFHEQPGRLFIPLATLVRAVTG